mgnify:FL=1|jgi:hypothetical protein
MNRTLKRPMFRIGGSAGTGITSGLDRPGYQNPLPAPVGSTKERLLRAVGQQPSNRNMSRFLTTFGLNLLSQPAQGSGFGGLLSTAATAAKEPTQELYSDLDAQRNLERQIALAAEQSDIESEAATELLEKELASKEKIAAMKQRDMFAAQTPEEQFRERLKVYGESTIPVIKNNATDLANFEVKHRNENYVQLDFVYNRGTKDFQPDFRSIPEGALTYNPKDGLAYRNVGGQFQKLNPFTLEPIKSIDGTE